jgi:hypothetical protein
MLCNFACNQRKPNFGAERHSPSCNSLMGSLRAVDKSTEAPMAGYHLGVQMSVGGREGEAMKTGLTKNSLKLNFWGEKSGTIVTSQERIAYSGD